MLKWLTITLVALFIFTTLLLGLGYLLKEHEAATKQLMNELDQERAEIQEKEKRKMARFTSKFHTPQRKTTPPIKPSIASALGANKQQIILENLTCTSTKQCVLIDIQFADLSCVVAINTIGASLLTKVVDDLNLVGKCPDIPENSQLTCELNICSYQ